MEMFIKVNGKTIWPMERVSLLIQMDPLMMVTGLMTCNTDLAKSHGKVERSSLKVSTNKDRSAVRVDMNGKMDLTMMATFSKMCSKDLECIILLKQKRSTRVNLQTTSLKVKASSFIRTVRDMKVSSKKVKCTDTALCSIRMEISTLANGRTKYSMELEFTVQPKLDREDKVSGKMGSVLLG